MTRIPAAMLWVNAGPLMSIRSTPVPLRIDRSSVLNLLHAAESFSKILRRVMSVVVIIEFFNFTEMDETEGITPLVFPASKPKANPPRAAPAIAAPLSLSFFEASMELYNDVMTIDSFFKESGSSMLAPGKSLDHTSCWTECIQAVYSSTDSALIGSVVMHTVNVTDKAVLRNAFIRGLLCGLCGMDPYFSKIGIICAIFMFWQ